MIISHNFRPVVAGVSGLGQDSGVIANLNQPMVDLTHCDPATISAYNQGLIPPPICPAGGGGGSPTTPIPNWLWIAIAVLGILLVTRR